MKELLKKLMYAAAPEWTTALMSARSRVCSHKVIVEWGCHKLNEKLIERFGNTVQDGPFAGLVLSPMTKAEHLGPYLLGVYESELDAAWDQVLTKCYAQILDVGAKFGYYAIGLAKRFPNTPVVAFDPDAWARQAIREMAAANGGANNLVIEGFCNPNWMRRNLSENSLVLSDCEGYEDALFAGDIPSRMRTATLIIETHDVIVPGVCDRLRNAFDKTHTIQVFGDSNKRRIRTEGMEFLSEPERNLANQEVRPPQLWLLCLPRAFNNE